MTTIPASTIVKVNPSVLSAGGSALDLNGLFLTTSARVPIGTVPSFPTLSAVKNYFGPSSDEAAQAAIYFNGYDNSPAKPGALLFAQYNEDDVAAYLRGGNVSGLTLAQLQALTGTLTVVMDGYTHSAGSFSLSAATSFSSAATIIETALTASEPTEASVTGEMGASFTAAISTTNMTVSAVASGKLHPGDTVVGAASGTTIVSQTSGSTGGTGVYVVSISQTFASGSLTSMSNYLDVTAVSSGTVAVGQTITGSGVADGSVITALGTGTGGVGSYVISGDQQSVASESITAVATAPSVSYDSVSGAFVVTSGITGAPSTAAFATGSLATPLKLTSATGAVLSQGADAATPGPFMDGVINVTQDWASFRTLFDPDDSGNANKILFAQWTNDQDDRYAYIVQDTDASATVSVPATGSLGYLIGPNGLNLSGTVPIFDPSDIGTASFICGAIASIDFSRTNGRITFAFRSQAGLVATVTDATSAANLIANGYNYYGAYATANENFVFFYPGQISGRFQWLDSYVNQIWLNNAFQLALMELLVNAGSIPYNQAGYTLIEQSLADPINQGLDFGAFRAGVPLSSQQIAEVNAEAGVPIDNTLATQGWYLQVKPASPQVRQARGTPPITFWYMDGESVQNIEMDSILVQ